MLDIARFTKVVDNEVEKMDNEGNISTVAGENVLWLAGLQVPHLELVRHPGAVLLRLGPGV